MRGSLKLKGNMALALKLNTVMDAARKAGAAPAPAAPAAAAATTAPAPAASPAATASASAPSVGAGLKSGPTFEAIQAAIARDGAALVKAVGGIITFDVTAPAARFTIDLKSGSGSFRVGDAVAPAKADLTITVSDDDFAQMAAGKLNAQQAFMKGKIKIKGNMSLAMKLQTVLDAARKGPAPKL